MENEVNRQTHHFTSHVAVSEKTGNAMALQQSLMKLPKQISSSIYI